MIAASSTLVRRRRGAPTIAEPRETGIIMTGPSVPAIIAGTKRQTRRVVDLDRLFADVPRAITGEALPRVVLPAGRHRIALHEAGAVSAPKSNFGLKPGEFHFRCPYADGATHLGDFGGGRKQWVIAPSDDQRLWVRETWRTERTPLADGIRYAADDAFVPIADDRDAAGRWLDAHRNGKHGTRWRSPLHIPRWASRITLELVEVRVQRLNDISEEDAQAEGIEAWDGLLADAAICRAAKLAGCGPEDARAWFAAIWEELHGAGAWALDPWVWAISFRRIT